MKAIYLLFVVFIDQQGYETMNQLNGTQYKTLLECKAAKVQYKESHNIKFFCGDETKYFNKEQKLY